MKTLKHSLLFIAVTLLYIPMSLAALQEGDIVGISEIAHDPSTALFEAATSSRFGHVGVVFKSGNDLVVYEAAPPVVTFTPLKDFLAYGNGQYAAIRRNAPLSQQDIKTIKAAADEAIAQKTPYNFTLIMNSESVNCSEFIMGLFGKVNIPVGRIEKIQDQNLMAFKGRFAKIAGDIPKDGQVVTPISVMQSAGWSKVEGPLEIRGNYTDLELFYAWKAEGLLDVFDYLWDLNEKTLKALATP